MKDWNKTGKIKAVLIAILSLPNLLMPIGANLQQGLLISILMPLIFGSIVIPLNFRFNTAVEKEIVKPHWNDNPLTSKKPLTLFHFGAFFFLSVGLSMLIGKAIKFQSLSQFGLSSVSFGIGILIGINLVLKWGVKKE
jgi:hypothetical protein